MADRTIDLKTNVCRWSVVSLRSYMFILKCYHHIDDLCVYVCFPASSVDLLISDGEEENSFLTLPNSVRQRRRLTFDLGEPALSDPQLLIQV